MKNCPGCSKSVLDDATSCYNCGYVFFRSEASKPIENKPLIDNSFIIPDIITPENSTPENSTPENSILEKNKPDYGKILGLIAAVVVAVAVIGAGIYFFLNSGDKPEENDAVAYESQVDDFVVATQTAPETTTPPETTTEMTTTTAPVGVSDEKIYITFFNFYISYLDGINSLNAGMIDFCTPQIKAEMAERFQYNKKSLFDLSRIDYDVDSLTTESNVISNDYTFYVKCVTRMYNRETHDEKDINYAVWKVTVTETDGNCVVSKMERDDKYKMGSNIETLDDSSSIF